MSITQIILSIAAAVFGPPDSPTDKDDKPLLGSLEDHYFCCDRVYAMGHGSGTECRKTNEGESKLCGAQLCCKAGYVVEGYTTTCTAPSERGPKSPMQFCCESSSTDNAGRLTGKGCNRGSSCDDVKVVCQDGWVNDDGNVTCL